MALVKAPFKVTFLVLLIKPFLKCMELGRLMEQPKLVHGTDFILYTPDCLLYKHFISVISYRGPSGLRFRSEANGISTMATYFINYRFRLGRLK